MGKASLIVVENLKVFDVTSADDEENDAVGTATNTEDRAEGVDGDDDDPVSAPARINGNARKQRGRVSFTLLGRVEVDHREMIEVDDDDE